MSKPSPKRGKNVPESAPAKNLVGKHLAIGWWSLLAFLTLGIVLETMHGFKIGWYLDDHFATRRLMWTLAHAHGVLVALVHLGFAATQHLRPAAGGKRRTASALLTGAGILLPGGFFAGGIWIYGGDPGLGILLVPVGAVLLFLAVLLTALSVRQNSSDEGSGENP